MQYVTTRNDRELFPVQHVLKHDRGADGGFFVPFRCTEMDKSEINTLLNLPFEQCMARVLNHLLDTKLTGWDVTFYTGRYPVRIHQLGHRMMVAEGWHNPEWTYLRLVRNIASLVNSSERQSPSQWLTIAVGAAVFAGICADMHSQGFVQPIDVVAVSGSFHSPASAWYAKKLGLPIGNIICCCNENGNLWDLISNGQMRTDGVSVPTDTPDNDIVIPDGLEYLIYTCGGVGEVERYVSACQQGRMYVPSDMTLERLRNDIYVSVIGSQRMKETIPRVYASRNYLLSPYDALCYCGLSDYWTRFGQTTSAVIFSERSVKRHLEVVADALGLSTESLKQYL